MRLWGSIALVLTMLVALSTSAAERDDREARAREAFALGRYAEAMELYGKLYAETAHPTYLRNIGRCHQNMGEPDKAISSFREYLRQAQARGLPAEQRTQVEGYIREMEELKARQERQRRDMQRPAAASSPPATSGPARRGDGAPAADVAARPARVSRQPDGTRRIVGLSIAGAGAVGVAVGAVFGFKSRGQDSEARGICPTGLCGTQEEITRHDQLVADAKSSRTVAIIGLAAGGAAIAAGFIVFLTAPRAPDPGDADAHVALWGDGRQSAGVALSGRW